jgi:HSP20 family protein
MANKMESEESSERTRSRPPQRSSSRQLQPQALLQDVDRLWDSFIERFGFGPVWPFQAGEQRLALMGQRPRVDVSERGDEIVVTAEVPGFRREDIDIEAADDVLTLRGEQSKETTAEEGGYHRREIMRGSFVRQIRLPCPVEIEQAKADYQDGMLTVTLPKSAQARSRKIPLSTTSGDEARSGKAH